MTMIEHYLEAVAAQLPKDSRDDIVAELRDLLLTRFEVEEERLGRGLTDDEAEAILRETGHPLVVAARYGKGPQSLIGPELFPYWLFGLKAGLLILVAVQGLAFLLEVLGGGHPSRAFGQAINGLISSGLTLIGVLTVVGAVFENRGMRPGWMNHWRVKDLPVLKLSDPANWTAAMASRAPSVGASGSAWSAGAGNAWPGSEPLAGIIAGVVFVLWWVGVFTFPGLSSIGLRGEDAVVVPAAIWSTLHQPILIYMLARIAIETSRLVQPHARRLQAAAAVVVAGGGLWIASALFQAGHWLTLTRGAEKVQVRVDGSMLNLHAWGALESRRGLPELAEVLSVTLSWSLAIIVLGLVFEIGRSVWHLVGPASRPFVDPASGAV